MDKSNICYAVFLCVCFFVMGFSVSQIVNITITNHDDIFEESFLIPNSEQEIIDNCKNLNLTESVYCLRNEIKPFYKYNVTDDKIAKNMTLDEIKEFGGDCGVYSYLYERLGIGLGFNATTNRYNGIKNVHYAHRWAEVWDIDEEKYCELNMLEVKCRKINYER